MLKIRLMRIGTKKRPFYRVVVVDERSKRTGAYVENVGTYNPLTEPKEVKLDESRVDYWIKKGAQLSDGYLRMVGKAPQRPPRKPKKQKEEAAAAEAPAASTETPAETTPTPEAPAETEATPATEGEQPKITNEGSA